MSFRRVVFLIVLVSLCSVLLGGCGGRSDRTDRAAAQPQPMPAGDFQKEIEAIERRAEEDRILVEQKRDRRRSFVQVAFHEIDSAGRVVVSVTNNTDRAIDDIGGGFRVEDAEGNYVAGSGFTEAVPGDVYLQAGQTRTQIPFISEKPELVRRLQADPDALRFAFEARTVTWADGSTEADLED